MNYPLVTIYIPNYNYGKYVKDAIESVLNQTYSNIELVIIDDGSTDNSREVINEYRSHPKIKIIYQNNSGLNASNNIAMNVANGKYIMRLDADDFLVNSAVGIMSAILESEPDVGLVFPDYYYVDTSGKIIGEEYRQNFEREVTLFDLPAHGACTMIRLEYLRNLGGYNETLECQDGYDLWIKFITNYKVTNVNKPLFYYRRHDNNLTNNEEKLIYTRRKIKEIFVNENKFKLPKCLAIIPVRRTFIDSTDLSIYKINGKTIYQMMAEEALKSQKINLVVITSSDENIINQAKSMFNNNNQVCVIKRPYEYEQYNISLIPTYQLVLDYLKENNENEYEIIVSLAIEYPFITYDVIDDAINTLVIFKADSVIGVRPDNSTYFQHNGHGMQPILDQAKYTKYERDALYKGISGITVSTTDNFQKNTKMVAGKIGHTVLEKRSTFGVFTKFDFEIFNLLIQNDELMTNKNK